MEPATWEGTSPAWPETLEFARRAPQPLILLVETVARYYWGNEI